MSYSWPILTLVKLVKIHVVLCDVVCLMAVMKGDHLCCMCTSWPSCLFWHVPVFNNNLFFECTELFPQDRQKYLFFQWLESRLYGQSWWETLMMSSPTWWKPKHCEIVTELRELHLHEGHCMANFLFHAFSVAITSLETIVSCDIFHC